MAGQQHSNGHGHARPRQESARRELPHSPDLEASVLGGILLRNEALATIPDLEIDAFYENKHKAVFAAIRTLEARGLPIDTVTIQAEIERTDRTLDRHQLEQIGGPAFLGELALRVPTADNVRHYADRLTLLQRNRRLIVELTSAAERAWTWAHEPDEMIPEILGDLGRLEVKSKTSPVDDRPWRSLDELADELWAERNNPWVPITLGGEQLARVRTGGIAVVMGDSGSGKTSLVLCMLLEHARDVGPVIMLSIELPRVELGARIVGQKCDASWEEALRGHVRLEDMKRVLDVPRFRILDRRRATLVELRKQIAECRLRWPGQPILVAIDYAQLLESNAREIRQRVTDAFAQIDDVAREEKVVVIALSQMSRNSAQRARKGEALGAETAALGAESAAIERYATLTLSIGSSAERQDGSCAVELSVGKARMSKGDRVWPMTYWGRTGLWRVAGDAKSADQVRADRDTDRESKERSTIELAMLAFAGKQPAPLTRDTLAKAVKGRTQTKHNAIVSMLEQGDLIEVNLRPPRTKYHLIWTPDRAKHAGISARIELFPPAILSPSAGGESSA